MHTHSLPSSSRTRGRVRANHSQQNFQFPMHTFNFCVCDSRETAIDGCHHEPGHGHTTDINTCGAPACSRLMRSGSMSSSRAGDRSAQKRPIWCVAPCQAAEHSLICRPCTTQNTGCAPRPTAAGSSGTAARSDCKRKSAPCCGRRVWRAPRKVRAAPKHQDRPPLALPLRRAGTEAAPSLRGRV